MENFQIVERKTIEQLVNELDFLNSQVLAKIKNPNDGSGLINELADINKKIANLTNLTNVLNYLSSKTEVALKNFTNFEKTNEKILQEQTQKVENFRNALELTVSILGNHFKDDISNDINNFKNSFKDSLIADIETKVDEIKNEINKKLKNIDLKRFEDANQNVTTAIENLNNFHSKVEKIYFKNNLLTGFLSFLGGGTVIGSLVYFFLR